MKARSSIYWLWHVVKGVRGRIVLNCVIGIIRISLSLIFVYLSKHIVDIATKTAEGNIYHWVCGLASFVVLQLIITLVNGRVKERNRIELTNHLRQRLFAKAMNSEWNGRDNMHSGDTMSRLGEDVRTVSDMVSEKIPQILLAAIQLIAASMVLFLLGRELLWILLFIMPIAVVVSKVFFRRLRTLTEDIRKQEGEIQSHMQEHLLKRILILCMDKLGETIQTLHKQQETLEKTVIHRVNYNTRAHLFIQMGFMTGYYVTFCWGAFGIMAGTVTYGMMTAFLQLVNQVQIPILNMSQYLPSVVQSLASVDRLIDVDEEIQQAPSSDEELSTLGEGPIGIQIENLSFTYPDNDTPTLSRFSHTFSPGSHTAIIGPTGEGKSTLIRLVLGVLIPSSGKISLIGSNAKTIPLRSSLRKVFSYVPQGNSLMSGTVRDNLLLGKANATDTEMREVLHLAAADFVFEREEGLDASCAEQGNGWSEGQAQRIAIARALLQPGRILLFDEACSALDNDTEKQILDNLQSHLKDRTLLWITHDDSVRERMDETVKI